VTPREHRLQSQEVRLRERELALRHWQSREAAVAKIAEGGFRSLLMMNGIGVLALGAFLAAAIPVPEAEDFVPFILMAIGLQSIGLVLAVSLSWTRYMKRRYEDRRDTFGTRNPWWWMTVLVSITSVVFFMAGIALVVYGGFTQLGNIDDDAQQSRMTRT
jgi:protein-S-isoprenylcysteine O-methyltransferase Ste14